MVHVYVVLDDSSLQASVRLLPRSKSYDLDNNTVEGRYSANDLRREQFEIHCREVTVLSCACLLVDRCLHTELQMKFVDLETTNGTDNVLLDDAATISLSIVYTTIVERVRTLVSLTR